MPLELAAMPLELAAMPLEIAADGAGAMPLELAAMPLELAAMPLEIADDGAGAIKPTDPFGGGGLNSKTSMFWICNDDTVDVP
jgi:hypothetical protein